MIKGIVFDMDGLMFDTERLVTKAWAYAGSRMGYDITEELGIKTLGIKSEDTKQIFIRHLGDDFDYEAARVFRFAYMTDYIEREGMPLKTGLIELLNFLRSNGYKITVATSTEEEKARYYFEKADITEYFSEIVCGDMVEHGKPEPDIYLKACEILGLPPEECIALEDSPMGILSAYRAGMKPVMIPDMVQPEEETSRLLFAKLPTLLDVIPLLKNLAEGS